MEDVRSDVQRRLGETIIRRAHCEAALEADVRNRAWARTGFADHPSSQRPKADAPSRPLRAYVQHGAVIVYKAAAGGEE